MSRNNTLAVLTAAACAASLSQQSFALEEFFSVPGTRAMGMGGANVAYASDSSAIWYNPAALNLTRNFSDVTIEYGDFVAPVDPADYVQDSNGIIDIYTPEKSLKYAAFSGGGFGVAIFQPYNFSSTAVEDTLFNGPQNREITTDYSEVKFAFSGSMSENISWGIGLDLINQTVNCSACEYSTSEDSIGLGASFGLLGKWTFLSESSHPIGLKVGTNYRSAAMMDDLYLLDVESDVIPTRPESLSYGFSLGMPFMIANVPFYIAGSVHLESLAYNDVLVGWFSGGSPVSETVTFEESRSAFGVELTSNISQDFSVYLRLGQSETEVDNTEASSPFPTGTDSSSIGIGVRLSSWVIDIAQESRTIIDGGFFNDTADEDEDLASMSISYAF